MPTKIHIVKAMFFPVVMYGCESWIIKRAELQRTDAFGLWCWRRLLRVPWTARRSNQSICKEICPEYSLEGLMLRLKLQQREHGDFFRTHFEKSVLNVLLCPKETSESFTQTLKLQLGSQNLVTQNLFFSSLL